MVRSRAEITTEGTRYIIFQNIQLQNDEILSHLPNAQTMRKTIRRQHQWVNTLPVSNDSALFCYTQKATSYINRKRFRPKTLVKTAFWCWNRHKAFDSHKILIVGLYVEYLTPSHHSLINCTHKKCGLHVRVINKQMITDLWNCEVNWTMKLLPQMLLVLSLIGRS